MNIKRYADVGIWQALQKSSAEPSDFPEGVVSPCKDEIGSPVEFSTDDSLGLEVALLLLFKCDILLYWDILCGENKTLGFLPRMKVLILCFFYLNERCISLLLWVVIEAVGWNLHIYWMITFIN